MDTVTIPHAQYEALLRIADAAAEYFRVKRQRFEADGRPGAHWDDLLLDAETEMRAACACLGAESREL